MTLPLDSKPFPGTQSDKYSYDRNMKPYQPPCGNERSDQHQFDDYGNYIEYSNDKWNNEIPTDQPMHRDATPGTGSFGDRQFASNSADLQSTGYGKNEGLNEIPYGTGAAFNRAETVVVDSSRADRGRES